MNKSQCFVASKLVGCLLLFAVSFSGCDDLVKNNQEEPYDGPKTVFGESVKKAKDLKGSMESQDEDVRRQVEELDK